MLLIQALMLLWSRCGSCDQGLPSDFDPDAYFTSQVNDGVLLCPLTKASTEATLTFLCLRKGD